MSSTSASEPFEVGPPIRAVLFDFGGVMTTSPFEAFAAYELEAGLPADLIRTINSTNPDDNAWALFERNEIGTDGFVERFQAEAAALGHTVDGYRVLACLAGPIRPEMVEALRRVIAADYRTACLTNNMNSADSPGTTGAQGAPGKSRAALEVMELFDHLIESSKLGIRKPEPAFYEHALQAIGVSAEEAVFLDDLGINLKPARAMGMRTIKVVSAAQALAELETILGLELR